MLARHSASSASSVQCMSVCFPYVSQAPARKKGRQARSIVREREEGKASGRAGRQSVRQTAAYYNITSRLAHTLPQWCKKISKNDQAFSLEL